MADQLVFGEELKQLERKLGVFDQFQVSCCGISQGQCFTLAELGRAEGGSLGELAVRLGVDSSTMSRTVNGLVDCGLVERSLDPADRRYVVLTLTTQGKKIYSEIETAIEQQVAKVWQAIPSNKREQVIESLQILVAALGEHCCQ